MVGESMVDRAWFTGAMATVDGDAYVVDDIRKESLLGNRHVATYATAIRAHGDARGSVIGVLAVFFDWDQQSQVAVDGVRLAAEERGRTRCLILDSRHRVIAASDRQGILAEQIPWPSDRPETGWHQDGGTITAWARTPGYETYRGLGWYGAIIQRPPA